MLGLASVSVGIVLGLAYVGIVLGLAYVGIVLGLALVSGASCWS